jgi:long-chain acyl-CoA synthetase
MAEGLFTHLARHFERHAPDRAYGWRRGYRMEWWTYAQVRDLAFRFAGELQVRKVSKSDRVMLWGENRPEWVAAFFGCALIGAVAVPMDDVASPDFAMRVLRQTKTKLLVCSRAHAHSPELNALQSEVLILDDLAQILSNSAAASPPYASIAPEDILQIVFTSGTTAEPKGVIITHGNVLANLLPLEREMQKYLPYERWVRPLRFLNLLPLSHVFGQFLGMFLPPLLGGTVIFQEDLKPSEIVETIRREGVSVLVSVPRVLQSLKQQIERGLESSGRFEEFRQCFESSLGRHFLQRWWIFRSVRRQFGWKFWAFISGGATLDGDTEEFWARLGYAAIQGYGLTETTSLISVNHPFKLGKGSIGKVLPGREIKIAEDGEILIRGGGIAAGYWSESASQSQAQEVTDAQGWYRTGDVGKVDEAGNLYFKGRKKDVIVASSGLNIYPEDLEAALRAQPDVKDCVVVGVEHGGKAEPCAVLIFRHNAKASGEELLRRANDQLAEFQRMRIWVPWPEEDFPRTSTQKSLRNRIAEFAKRHFLQTQEKSAVDDSPLLDLICHVTGRAAALGNNLDSDLGLSSLERVELIGALEDRYQIDLSETRLSAARTLRDIEKMIGGESGQRLDYHYPEWVLGWPVTWARWLAHHFLMFPAMMLLGWPRIEGRENLRGCKGPLLVVCNHIGDVDVVLVQTALPARFRNRLATAARGEALEALHSPSPSRGLLGKTYDRVRWALGVSLLNLFPLPREAGFRKSFAYAGRAVDRGYSVLVFPEGRHTVDGNINPFRAGIGLLAKNLRIPVLPLRIVGLFEVKKAGKKFAFPQKISVRVGRPRSFAPGADPEQIARELQSVVESL